MSLVLVVATSGRLKLTAMANGQTRWRHVFWYFFWVITCDTIKCPRFIYGTNKHKKVYSRHWHFFITRMQIREETQKTKINPHEYDIVLFFFFSFFLFIFKNHLVARSWKGFFLFLSCWSRAPPKARLNSPKFKWVSLLKMTRFDGWRWLKLLC